MNCLELEKSSQHEASPGVVSDEELVARGAISPVHFNKSGVKAAFVRPAHLVTCELSVWRTGVKDDFDADDARAEMSKTLGESQALKLVLGADAGAIRRLRIDAAPDRRVFCVVDDCRTDLEDGYHPCHATLGMNEATGDWEQGSEHFLAAVEGLRALFVKRQLWAEAA